MTLSNIQQKDAFSASILQERYFEFQADVGLTKHIGSTRATNELLDLCNVTSHSYILDVGCGVGFTSQHIAENYGAQVVGVDLRSAMVAKAREYAQQAGLTNLIHYEVGDACRLPLPDNTFDAVICESVLAFIPDQKKAIDEFIRVTKPGGYVGFTEAIWYTLPPEDARERMDEVTGAGGGVQPTKHWVNLLTESSLYNLTYHHYPLNFFEDAKHQIKQMSLRRLFAIWGKTLKLLLTEPDYRTFARDANQIPRSLMKHIGYGVYAGQVPD